MNSFLSYIFCALITCIILSKIIPILKKDFLAQPNKRSSHSTPIPSGGGIAFVITSSLFSLFSGYVLPIYCIPLAIVGFLDDRTKIPAFIRYIFQFLTVIFF